MSGLEALATDTAVSVRAASSFPEPLAADAVVDLPTRIGNLYLHADDRVMTPFIAEHEVWGESEALFLQAAVQPGMTFVDVGATAGYFSILGSTLAGPEGRVIAIEPEQRNVALLKANLWRNGCDNAVVLPMAAHRQRGFLRLRHDEASRGGYRLGEEDGASSVVPCTRLDDVLAAIPVDVIKVDTTVDHDVIAGTSAIVATGRPLTVMCKFWLDGLAARKLDPQQVAQEYEQLGFELGLPLSGVLRASPGEVVAAAGDAPDRVVDLVLRTGS